MGVEIRRSDQQGDHIMPLAMKVAIVVLALAPLILASCGAEDGEETASGAPGNVTQGVRDVSVAQGNPKPVTGTWTIQPEEGIETPTVTFEQEGERLTGHYSSTVFGDYSSLTGTLEGHVITFTVPVQWEGTTHDLSFTGEYDGSKTIKGTYVTDFGIGSFTAVRK